MIRSFFVGYHFGMVFTMPSGPFEPFGVQAQEFAKSDLRRLILSLFGPKPRNGAKVDSEGSF